LVLAVEEYLVPEGRASLEVKARAKQSYYPWKQEDSQGAILFFQVLIELGGLLTEQPPENPIAVLNVHLFCSEEGE